VTADELNQGDAWACPHAAEKTVDGESLCIFHLPLHAKTDHDVMRAVDATLARAANSRDPAVQRQTQQFIGANFGAFEPLSETLAGLGAAPLNLKHATFEGPVGGIDTIDADLLLTGAVFHDRVDFAGTRFNGSADFRGARFDDWADFRDATFTDRADFRIATFTDWAYFDGATCTGALRFRGTTIEHIAQFNDLTVTERADFRDAAFEDEAYFRGADFRVATFEGARFENYTDIRAAIFRDRVTFQETAFDDVAYFPEARFCAHATFRRLTIAGLANFRGITIADGADFREAVFESEARFTDATLTDAEFDRATFAAPAEFSEATLADTSFREATFTDDATFHCQFETGADFTDAALAHGFTLTQATIEDPLTLTRADLTDARLTGVDLTEAAVEQALLSRATLFGTDLRGASLSGAVISDVRIDDETQFLGQPGDARTDSTYRLRRISAIPVCVYDPLYPGTDTDISKAKSFYHSIEELSGRSARPQLQAHCSVRRKDLERRQYKQAAKRFPIGERKLVAGFRYSQQTIARAIMLYGESPWRIILTGAVIIGVFSGLYAATSGVNVRPIPSTHSFALLSGWDSAVSAPVEILLANLYFSVVTFTTLGYGDITPAGPESQLLAGLESLLGASLIALLVFVLGRRAAR